MPPAVKDQETIPARNPAAPVDWDAHQQNMQRRKAARDARKAEMRSYLDPEVAAEAEARKPRFEYLVSATFMQGKKEQHEKRKIQARDSDEAWAKFCDAIGTWPSPGGSDREIKQIKQLN